MSSKKLRPIEDVASAWFHYMGLAGLILAVLVFLLYAAGVFPFGVTPADSAKAWSLESEEFLEQANLGFGSLWFLKANNGYLLSSASLAVLASTAFPTLIALTIAWFRRRDYLYASMSIVVSLVLLMAILGKF